MRKKLDTRFPAARIKKIMQADEDVGKIAMAVPLLVSKALEQFLQDLCDRTYEITLQRGAKTLNSTHLKQCVQSFNVFDFLRDIVGKVPDLGGSDAAGDDRSATKRRKVVDDNHNDGDEKDKPPETAYINGNDRGRGRGRGRGKLRHLPIYDKPKPTLDSVKDSDSKENGIPVEKTEYTVKVRNFDLNLDLDENGDTSAVTHAGPSPKPVVEMKPGEFPGWFLADVEKMDIDPVQLANFNSRVDEDEEDYDEEE